MFLTSRIKVLDTLVGISVLSVFYKALSKCCAIGTLVTCFFMSAGDVSLTDAKGCKLSCGASHWKAVHPKHW